MSEKIAVKKCENCVHFVEKLHSTTEGRPDSRCGHRSAEVGFDDEGALVSLLTIREARLARSSRKENFPEGVAEYDQCGPTGVYYYAKKA